MREITHWDVTWGSLFRIAAVVAFVALLIVAREVVGALCIAIVVSIGLGPIVSFLERVGVNRLLATFGVFLAGVLAVAAVVYAMVPLVVSEAGSFAAYLAETLPSYGIAVPSVGIHDIQGWLSNALGFLGTTNISLTGAVGAVFQKLVLTISMLMVAFYLTVDKDGVERLIRGIVPDAHERVLMGIFAHFKEKVRRWFGAQLAISALVGFIVWIGMWILGVPYPLVLGLLAALFELVPIIGPIIAGAVAFLAALGDSLSLALYAALFSLVVQQLENHILVPIIMGRSVEVHPVMVILALLIGGTVGGFIGVVLSVPAAILVKEVFEHFEEQKRRRPAQLGV